MSLYLDASVVVPTLIEEGASASVAQFIRAASEPLIIGDFTAAEVASAISRLVRMALLTDRAAEARLSQFDTWRLAKTIDIDLRASDVRLAGLLVRRFDLAPRTPDALHVAICRRANHALVTLDNRLAAAATALGVGVCRPV